MPVPAQPKIYHIIHADRLASVVADGCLWCDAIMGPRAAAGTTIGMSAIKQRRLQSLLNSRPGLKVGDCVPFYFCPRSIMLFLIHRGNHPDMPYHGGQGPILHLESDLHATVAWAEQHDRRWAFTLSNAGANYFEDRCEIAQLGEINWGAVHASKWAGTGVSSLVKEGKQAEFLVEQKFPWELVERIGVSSPQWAQSLADQLRSCAHQPRIEIMRDWYY